MKSWIPPLLFLATLTFARANNNMRAWKLATGETHRAELVAYDEAKKTVTWRLENQREFQVGHADLSTLDQARLLEWTGFGEEMQAKLEKIGGTLTRHTGTGKFTTEYLERDTARLQQAGCKVSVHAFKGGHQEPPPSVQEKAFRWLPGDD
jgi:hypothetical protein